MDAGVSKESLLAAALRLAPHDRLWLVERVASSVRHELETPAPAAPPAEAAVDQSLNKLVNSLETSEWEAMDVEDPFEWLKELRQKTTDVLKPK
jgi:hypothetical protein